MIYSGGDFSVIGGELRGRLAEIDAPTGVVSAWSPTPFISVRSLVIGGGRVYAGGEFTSVGGQGRRGIAAFEP